MESFTFPSPRSSSEGGSSAGGRTPDQFDEYHALVSAVFADHRPLPDDTVGHAGHSERCSCGSAWPCTAERHAARLLDWV